MEITKQTAGFTLPNDNGIYIYCHTCKRYLKHGSGGIESGVMRKSSHCECTGYYIITFRPYFDWSEEDKELFFPSARGSLKRILSKKRGISCGI
jgi:hypothetical protein